MYALSDRVEWILGGRSYGEGTHLAEDGRYVP